MEETDGDLGPQKSRNVPTVPVLHRLGAPLLGIGYRSSSENSNATKRAVRQHMAQNDFLSSMAEEICTRFWGGSVKSEGLTKATVYVLSLLTWKLTSFSALKFSSAPQLTLNQLTDADLIAWPVQEDPHGFSEEANRTGRTQCLLFNGGHLWSL